MEVILKKDINRLGYKGDIVNIKNGYARNYLIPKGLAILATDTNKKIVTENQKQRAYKEDKIRNEAEELANSLKDATVTIGAKSGTSGKIFGSVNTIQIADAIKKQFNQEIDRKKITIDGEAIKELGAYTAKVELHKEIIIDIKFEVIAE